MKEDLKTVQSTNSNQKDAYTVKDIAEILDMPERSAYAFCNSTTEFIVKRIGPRNLRINKKSFHDWWNSSGN